MLCEVKVSRVLGTLGVVVRRSSEDGSFEQWMLMSVVAQCKCVGRVRTYTGYNIDKIRIACYV